MGSSLAAIHVAKKQLGLDDETYRDKLFVITGKSSAADMTESQRQDVLAVFRKEGFKPIERRQSGAQKLTGRYAKKMQALWIAAFNLGIVRERDDSALIAFVKRQTALDHVRFLHVADDARRAIEALKRWMEREARVDWSDRKDMAEYLRADGYRIARAQWAILNPRAHDDFWPVVTDLVGARPQFRDFSDKQWIQVMNLFGGQIRQAKAVKP